MKILIADDEQIPLAMLERVLCKAGHDVRTATNGEEALAFLREGAYRLVISDWEMPRMNGVELCRAVRNGEFAGYVYFILLTAREGTESIVEGLSAGADDFVHKPFIPAELLMRVRTGERILSMETRDLAIFAMAKLAESRDPETGNHIERVRGYCRILASSLATQPKFAAEVDAQFVRLIYATSPLHDIGKVAIPDCVLLKPARLSDREFEIMKMHTILGSRTLDAALREYPEVRFLQMARDIALTHHERFDGTGYPAQLRGEDIPLCGRVLALADVYDALTSKRVYKESFTHDIARAIVLDGRGTHFDPDIVDAFVQNEREFVEVQRSYTTAGTEAA